MANPIAYAMLLIWPLVILWMFRRWPPERALIWAVLGGYMVLPQLTEFNLPMIPALDKVSIPNLTAFAVCWVLLGLRFSLLPDSWPGKVLMVAFIVGPVATVFNNTAPIEGGTIVYGQLKVLISDAWQVPGMRIYDAVSELVRGLILMLPFFMARRLLATPEALREILVALMAAGLIYSLPMLFEARFSPQLHTWIYGFFQHDFAQMMRDGGFRPIVFMPHALWVAFFALMAFVAALALTREADHGRRPRLALVAIYLGVVLIACRSMGVQGFALALLPLILFVTPRLQLHAALACVSVPLVYPLVRGLELANVYRVSDFVAQHNPERAQSLAFRFYNEDLLLAHAAQQPLFGWGAWGRNLLRDFWTGELASVPDGQWIITIGSYGWVGFLAKFGLLALPVVLLWLAYRRTDNSAIPMAVGPLALILGVNMLDLLPNATLIPFTWLLAGALLGHGEAVIARKRAAARDFRATRSVVLQGIAAERDRHEPDRERTVL